MQSFKKKTTNVRRTLSMLLAVCLVLTLAPMTASAAHAPNVFDLNDIGAGSENQSNTGWSYVKSTNSLTVTDDIRIIGSLTSVTGSLYINTPTGKIVTWDNAVYEGAASPGFGLIQLSGPGTFEMTSGSISVTGTSTGIYNTSGVAVISGGEVLSENGIAISNDTGTVYISDGEVKSTGTSGTIYNTAGTLDISGGTVAGSGTYAINNQAGTLNISDGTVTCSGNTTIYNGYASSNSGTLNLSGGTVKNTNAVGTAILNSNISTLKLMNSGISSVEIIAVNIGIKSDGSMTSDGGIINVSGNIVGNLTSEGSSFTINGDFNGDLEIVGGTVIVTGSHSGAILNPSVTYGRLMVSGIVKVWNTQTFKNAMHSDISSTIEITTDIELSGAIVNPDLSTSPDDSVFLAASQSLIIPAGLSLEITNDNLINIQGYILDLEGEGSVTVNNSNYDGFTDARAGGTLNLQDITINLKNSGYGGIDAATVNVNNDAVIRIDAAGDDLIFIGNGRTLNVNIGGLIDIDSFNNRGIYNMGTLHINGGDVHIGAGDSGNYGIFNDDGLLRYSSGALSAEQGGQIYLEEGSNVQGLAGIFVDHGFELVKNDLLSVGGSTPSVNGLTAGEYTYDTGKFYKLFDIIINSTSDTSINLEAGEINGETLTVDAEAVDSSVITYQWQLYDESTDVYVPVPGAAGIPSYALPDTLPFGDYIYRCVLSAAGHRTAEIDFRVYVHISFTDTGSGLQFEVLSNSAFTAAVIGVTADFDSIIGGSGGSLTIPASVIYTSTAYTVTEIGNGAFTDVTSLSTVVIPDSVTQIAAAAFAGCSSLSAITIPNSVVSIGTNSFGGCFSLNAVIIPDSVLWIDDNPFAYCSSLQTVAIGAGLEFIGDYAFDYCSSLLTFTVDPGNGYFTAIDGALFDKSAQTLIRYPSGSAAGAYIVPGGVTTIVCGAFICASNLTTVTIPGSIASIESHAFEACYGLVSLIFKSDVPNIGYSLFSDVNGPITVTVPAGTLSNYQAALLSMLPVGSTIVEAGGGSTGGNGGGGGTSSLSGSFSGGNGTYAPGSSAGIIYTINKDFSQFNSVSVDGTALTLNEDYTAANGSTVITLLPAYLDTLTAGTYTMRVNFRDSTYATASFTVTDNPETPPNTGAGIPFEDVGENDWFVNSVMWAYENGLMTGTSTSPMLFSPNTATTRGMIVTILYLMEGSPDVSGLENPFSDVAAGQWYTSAIKWAAANGIVSGYGGGLYGPEDSITREQLAVILNNYAEKKGLDLPELRAYPGFSDNAEIADYAADAIARFFKAEIISGKPGNAFDPKGNATRAEMATMLMRFLEAIEE